MSFKFTSTGNKKNNNDLTPTIIGFAFAATVGAALGLLFAPKKGEEIRENALKEAKRIALHFRENRQEIQQKIQEVFGEVNEDLERAYLEIKGNILAASQDLLDKSKLTQEKYKKIVKDTVKNFSESRGWAHQSLEKLLKLFEKEQIFPLKKAKKIAKKTSNSKLKSSTSLKKRVSTKKNLNHSSKLVQKKRKKNKE